MQKKSKIKVVKKFVVLAAVLGFVVLMACLPKLVAFVWEGSNLNVVQFEEMQSIQLEIREPLSFFEKLILYDSRENNFEASAEEAMMNKEEVEAAVLREIAIYEKEGIIEPLGEIVGEYRPIFIWHPEISEIRGIVWDCVVQKEGMQGEFSLLAMLDDETGKLLWLHVSQDKKMDAAERERVMQKFVALYFESWGMLDYEKAEFFYKKQPYVGDNVTARYFLLQDTAYGEVKLAFYVSENGFYFENVEK